MCVLVVVCLRPDAGSAVAAADGEEKKKSVPLYTNEDLQRISPYRDETGVNSQPAAPPASLAGTPDTRTRGEGYWRQEADRLRERLRPLQERAAELRLRIEERRRQPPRRGTVGDPQREALERRLHDLEERIRDTESRFEDRARRERAMPGWLR
jgi:hypothetical protein